MHPLLDRFEFCVERTPNRLAASDQSLTLDYQSLQAAARGLAERIEAGSSRRQVGILAPTSTAGAVAIFASWYAGRTPTPLNFLLAPGELAKVVRDADLELVVTIERFAPLVENIGLKPLLLNSESLAPGKRTAPNVGAEDVGALLYTSGTAGDPKGVELTFDNLARNALACIEHARIDTDQAFLSVLPQFHSFGFTGMTIVPLVLGATAHYLPRFTPLGVVQTIAEKRISVFMAIPSMYAAILNMKSVEPAQFASLKLAISGGEPLPPRLESAFRERLGVTLTNGYGLTETSPVVAINVPWDAKPGSVGRALPGIQVNAQNPDGSVCPAGQEGELVIRGHCVMRGYRNQSGQTSQVLRDGAFFTGDMGKVDADGHIFITGRIKDMLIIGGENVFPGEIEAVLCTHPAVAEAAVVGRPDPVRGEQPIAFVLLKEGAAAEADEIRRACRAHLADYKVPREVRVVNELPRGSTGKVLKRELRARL